MAGQYPKHVPRGPCQEGIWPPEWVGGNYCLFTIYPGQNTTLVLVAMPPHNDSSPLSPLRAACGLRGERPPHGTMQGHLSVQPPWSPGEVKRPRNGTTLRKQLGNVCWTERPVGTARTVGTRSQEDVPPRPPMTCTWGMVVIRTGVTESQAERGGGLGAWTPRPVLCLSLCGWCSGSAGAWSRARTRRSV